MPDVVPVVLPDVVPVVLPDVVPSPWSDMLPVLSVPFTDPLVLLPAFFDAELVPVLLAFFDLDPVPVAEPPAVLPVAPEPLLLFLE